MKRFDEDEEDVVDGVVRDGGRVRVPMVFMDGVQRGVSQRRELRDAAAHRPGYRSAQTVVRDGRRDDYADGLRVGSYAAMCNRLSTAWRGGDATELGFQNELSPGGPAPSAYDEFKRRLSSAWRTPPRTNPNAGGTIERQAEAWRHGR